MHRQWVALVDDENPKDSGTQGYLQLSVAIVGPGDKLKVGCFGGGGIRKYTKDSFGLVGVYLSPVAGAAVHYFLVFGVLI